MTVQTLFCRLAGCMLVSVAMIGCQVGETQTSDAPLSATGGQPYIQQDGYFQGGASIGGYPAQPTSHRLQCPCGSG
jgi:hypothetical protein